MKKFIVSNTVNKKKLDAENKQAFDSMVKKWETAPKFTKKVFKNPGNHLEFSNTPPPGRESPKIASKVTPGGLTAAKEVPTYTGTKMIGVGQMHKSNAVPIFNHEAAEDVAKMRRN